MSDHAGLERLSLSKSKCLDFQSPSERHRTPDYLVTLPMVLARQIQKVLILGGGDAHPARLALAFPEAEKVTRVELDPVRYLLESIETFDVIINDVEFFHSGEASEHDLKRYAGYLKAIAQHLNPGGIGCTMDPLDQFTRQLTERFIPILKVCDPRIGDILAVETELRDRVEAIYTVGFPHVRFQTCSFLDRETEHYTYFSNEPIVAQHRALPKGVHFCPETVNETLQTARSWELRPGEILFANGPRFYRQDVDSGRINRWSLKTEVCPEIPIALDPVLAERLKKIEAEHAWGFVIDDPTLYERILETHASRRFLNVGFEQTPVLPHTAYQRTRLVEDKCQNIILIGDDDLLSIPLALSGHHVTVLELDPVTIAAIEHFKAKWHLEGITVFAQDLTQPIAAGLCGRFDVAFLDPLSTHECIEVFLSRAVGCLREGGALWMALSDAGEPLGRELATEMGLLFQKRLRNFNHYYTKEFTACRYVSHYLHYQKAPQAKPTLAATETFSGDLFAFEQSYDYHAVLDYYDCGIFSQANPAEIIRQLYEVGPEGTQIVLPTKLTGKMNGFLHWGESSMRIRIDVERRWVGIDLFPVTRNDLFFWQPRIRSVLKPKTYVSRHSERNPGHLNKKPR